MEKDLIEQFLDKKMYDAINTRKNYRSSITTYFKLIDKDINTYLNNGYKNDDYEQDLLTAYKKLNDKGRGSLTIRQLFNAVKQFMTTHDRSLKDLEFWDTLQARMRGAEPKNDEARLNRQDIKEILNHGNTCSRAMFLVLLSSGRRIGEILALVPKDINTKVSPATLNIRKSIADPRKTKTGQKTLCYISDEARDAYLAWMEERDAYLKTAEARSVYPKNKNDPRVFPMSYQNVITIWQNLLIRSNLVEWEYKTDKWGVTKKVIIRNEKWERMMQHPHCLRKTFRSYFGDPDYADFLMGHGTPLTKTYRGMKDEDLAKLYLDHMPNVTIFETQPDLSGINEEIKAMKEVSQKKDDEIRRLRDYIQDFEMEMRKLLREKDRQEAK